ncbi:MATE family efflux transporter [Peribacillus sp. SCS-37]|uniref:MATE family efflux transporter n=1 Tax=Paraperibacillus esterisolvens TaxID=3115296 RepID=UPI00390668AB
MKNKKKLTLFALTWPLFVEIFLHMLMGNMDTLMLSQYSDHAVAAVGVATQLFSIIIIMFGFVAAGTSILAAQYLGAGREKEASELSVVSLAANLLFGLVLSIIISIFSQPLLGLMGLPQELLADAEIYLKIVGSFAFVQALIMTAGAILRSRGYTRDAMLVTIGMNIVHLIGNYIFIFGPLGLPVLGVEGTAISTVVSRLLGFAAILTLLIKRVPGKLPFKRLFSLDKIYLKNLLKIGVPAAGEHLSYELSQIAITFFIALLGTAAISTKVYTQNLMMFIYLFAVAIAQGTQILIGRMTGGGEYEKAYHRCLKSLKAAMLISFLCAVVFAFFSNNLLGLFTSDKEILATGAVLIWLTVILEPGRTFNLVIIGALRAAGDVRFPVVIGILSQWGISVSLAYLLGIKLELGLIGVWIALAADEWLRGLIMLWRWKSRVWERKGFFKTEAGADDAPLST